MTIGRADPVPPCDTCPRLCGCGCPAATPWCASHLAPDSPACVALRARLAARADPGETPIPKSGDDDHA